MKPKRAIIRDTEAAAALRSRPRVVFSREDESASAKGSARQRGILIVEDDYLIASQMANALTEAGFAIAGIANSAEEAVELAEAQHPALVVMDIRIIGQRDGVDTAIELFATHGVRCIFATAYPTAEAQTRAQSARPLGWVPKPYTPASLVEAVRGAFRELDSEKN